MEKKPMYIDYVAETKSGLSVFEAVVYTKQAYFEFLNSGLAVCASLSDWQNILLYKNFVKH